MSLKDILEKMKLVEFEQEAAAPAPAARSAAAPPPPPRRPAAGTPPAARLEDVVRAAGGRPQIDETALPAAAPPAAGAGGVAEVPDFPAIYTASGVSDPAHGFSAYKVLEILSSADFAALDPRAKAAALMGFLKMNPSGAVAIGDVIQDALKRDQALDAFEEFLRKKLDERRARLEQDNERLQAEIDALTQRNREAMDANRRQLEAEKERFATWQARKRIEERKLFDAVAPFVEQNPVSLTGGGTPPAGGGGTPRGAAS